MFVVALHAVLSGAVQSLGMQSWLVNPVLAVLAIVGAAMLVAAMRGRLRLLMDDRPISATRRLLERIYFLHWGACLAASVLYAPLFVLGLAGLVHLGAAALLSCAIAYGVATYAVFWRPRHVLVKRIDVPIKGLPAAFDGYRIAQLSDIHIGSLFPESAMTPFIEAANRLDADLVALTGDYLTSGGRFHTEVARVLGALKGRDGTIAVWGNHDNYNGREPLRTLLLEGGIELLENSSTKLRRDESEITVVGVDDIYSRRADVDATFRDVDPSETIIALVHDPKQFPACADRGANLVLTGHTHWGQIGVPLAARRINLARRFFKFSAGTYYQDEAMLYVHPGIGSTGPPIRYGVAPEVTLFTLRKA